MGFRRTALVTAITAAACASAATATPMIALYGTPTTVKRIVAPGTSTALPIDGRVTVVEPNGGHLYAGDRDKPYRLDKIKATDLIALRTGEAMAAYLKNRIDNPCVFSWGRIDCQSGIAMIDEIDRRFQEPAPDVTKYPWTLPIAERPAFVPKIKEGQPGLELSQAMQILANTPHADGGNYAQHVHLFLAPGPLSSLGLAGGKYHNMGRDLRPHYPTYEGVRKAFQLSGGTWLEMYHYKSGVRYPFNTREWKMYPYKVMQWMTAPGTSVVPATQYIAKGHFMMSNKMPARLGTKIPAPCYNLATPQGCQFALASTPRNLPILRNGPGAYRMEGNELEWRKHLRLRFFN